MRQSEIPWGSHQRSHHGVTEVSPPDHPGVTEVSREVSRRSHDDLEGSPKSSGILPVFEGESGFSTPNK